MKRPVHSALLAGVAGVAMLVAGCSGKQEPPAPTATESPSAHGSLAECLKAEGISESSGPAAVLGPPPGVDPAAWDAAMKACSDFAPGPAGP